MNAACLTLLLLTLPGDRPDLRGTVVAADGAPVAGAHVLIYTAGVRAGTSPTCPSCYPDCGKRTESQGNGEFAIPTLDPTLIFRVLVIADGFEPTFVRQVDPGAGPVRVQLAATNRAAIPPERIVRGQVVDPTGQPVAGATVEAHAYRTEARSGSGPGVFDPLAITDRAGNFTLASNSPIRDVDLEVTARDLAPALFRKQKPAPATNRLELGVGVAVTGRLVQAGQPVAGVNVGLVQVDRSSHELFVPLTIGTDAAGGFTFSHVPPELDCIVFGVMASLKGRGGAPAQPVKVGPEGGQVDVGDLALVPGHRVGGQVLLSDGKPIPPQTRVQISREGAWDWCSTTLDAAGRFEFTDLPAEPVTLYVALPGYHLSSRNKSVDPQNPSSLRGWIDGDRASLKILLEPGR